jgi:hypothetical protein
LNVTTAFGVFTKLFRLLKVERIGAADGQRQAVHHNGVALDDLLEDARAFRGREMGPTPTYSLDAARRVADKE